MSYQSRLNTYERIKAEINRTAKSPDEYERRIQSLADKLKI